MKRSLLLIPILMLICGCGRSYTLLGLVSHITQGQGSILEVRTNPARSEFPPLSEATVTLFHELNKDGSPKRDSGWKSSVKTDANGRFNLFSYATPGQENLVGLEISAPGYETVYITYVDYIDPDEQYFTATLRKKV